MNRLDAPSDRRRAWSLGCGSILLLELVLGVLARIGPEALRTFAVTLLVLIVLVGYYSVGLTLIARQAGLGRGPLDQQAFLLRAWVARFAKDPEGLWIHWAEQVSSTELGLKC